MSEEIKELFQEYRDGKITRRGFMRRMAILTGSVAGANALIAGLMQDNAMAQVDPGDPAILWRNIEYAGKAGPVFGYLARPAATGKHPGLVLIHANQGLTNNVRDVARRRMPRRQVVAADVSSAIRSSGCARSATSPSTSRRPGGRTHRTRRDGSGCYRERDAA